MKFYIATRFNRRNEVGEIHKILLDKGYKFLSTWDEEDKIKPYDKHLRKARKRAVKCINAAKNCDVFILLSDEEGTGMYVELGTAIMSNLLKGKPKIYIIGNYLNRSMFFFHPIVKRKKSIEDVLKDIILQKLIC